VNVLMMVWDWWCIDYERIISVYVPTLPKGLEIAGRNLNLQYRGSSLSVS